MAQRHEQRTSDSPFIDKVWRSTAISDGTYLVTPDGSWDLITSEEADGSRIVFITGQATKATRLPYKAGQRSVVISLAAGTYLPYLKGTPLIDNFIMLPIIDGHSFLLAEHLFPLPAYESAEELINQMVCLGVLANDALVESILRGKPISASKRSVQRHFKTATGLSPKKHAEIKRAQEAVRMLKAGKDPASTAAETGYYDQPHLTKSLKLLMDSLPSDVDDVNQV